MTDAPIYSGNVEAALARLEGKIDLLVDRLDRNSEETVRIRDRVHEIANDLTQLVVLNIPTKLTNLEARVSNLEVDREQRKGAMSVVKAMWALIGACGGAGIAIVIRFSGVL